MCNIGVGLKCHCIEKRGADLKWKFCFMSRVVVFMIMEFLSHHTVWTTTMLTQKNNIGTRTPSEQKQHQQNNISKTTSAKQHQQNNNIGTRCRYKNNVGIRTMLAQEHYQQNINQGGTTTMLTKNQYSYKNNIRRKTTSSKQQHSHNMLAQKQRWHKNSVGPKTLKAQERHQQSNSINKNNQISKTTTRVKQQCWHKNNIRTRTLS